MDRSRSLELMAARLNSASLGERWDLLERAVGELGPQVQALAAHGPWNAPERAALLRLRAAHDAAAHATADAAAGMQARLDGMRDNKEGWMAYALAGELEPGDAR